MGWFSIKQAILNEDGNVKAALQGNVDYRGCVFEAVRHIFDYHREEVTTKARQKIAYWTRRFGIKNPFKHVVEVEHKRQKIFQYGDMTIETYFDGCKVWASVQDAKTYIELSQ